MVFLLSTLLELSFSSKIKLPKWTNISIVLFLLLFIILVTVSALAGLCNKATAILDFSCALCTLILTLKSF